MTRAEISAQIRQHVERAEQCIDGARAALAPGIQKDYMSMAELHQQQARLLQDTAHVLMGNDVK